MTPLTKSPNQEAWEDFRGVKCFCGASKQANQSFCKKHYYELPEEMQKALWKRFGSGYEEAYHEAKDYLKEEQQARDNG